MFTSDAGSDSDDNTEGTNLLSLSIATTDNLLANQPSRPSRYNFYSELGNDCDLPDLTGSNRNSF
jgi:hypothetical protein